MREFSDDDLEVIVTKVSNSYIEIGNECRLTCEWLFGVIDFYSQYSDYIPAREFSYDDLEVIVTKVSNSYIEIGKECRLTCDYIPVREFSNEDLEVIVTKASNTYFEIGDVIKIIEKIMTILFSIFP